MCEITVESRYEKMRVTKAQMVADVYHQLPGVSRKVTQMVIDEFLDQLMNNVADGETVMIRKLGKFDRVNRPARTVYQPRTGEKFMIQDKYYPRFIPGKTFKQLTESR